MQLGWAVSPINLSPSEPCPWCPQFGAADSVCRVAVQTLELRPAKRPRTLVRFGCIHQTGLPRRCVSCCCAAGLSLLNGLLTYDATRRMTVAEALEHEYFRVSWKSSCSNIGNGMCSKKSCSGGLLGVNRDGCITHSCWMLLCGSPDCMCRSCCAVLCCSRGGLWAFLGVGPCSFLD